MTLIANAPVAARRTLAPTRAPEPGSGAPDELVGGGSTSARWLGGVIGFGAGVGALTALTAIKSPLRPVQVGTALLGIGALVGGPVLGQHLLGQATRLTGAEAARTADAKQADIDIEYRAKVEDARGNLDSDEKSEVSSLRTERTKLAQARPDVNVWGRIVAPVALGVGAMVLGGYLAMKLTPDDGKGINALFNTMFAAPAAGAMGAWAGVEGGRILGAGPHKAEVPTESKARIAEIDRRLDAILGTDA